MMGSGYRQSIGEQYGKNRKCTNGDTCIGNRKHSCLRLEQRVWRGAVENEMVGWVGGSSKGEAIPSSGLTHDKMLLCKELPE